MKKLKELIKIDASLAIAIGAVVVIVLVLTIVLSIVAASGNDEEVEVNENDNTSQTEVEDSKEYIVYLNSPISIKFIIQNEEVISCELLDDTANNYFTTDDFVGHNLITVLATVRNTLLDNAIDVSSIDITTNWHFDYTEDEIFQGILKSSEYDNDYTLNISYSYDIE